MLYEADTFRYSLHYLALILYKNEVSEVTLSAASCDNLIVEVHSSSTWIL